MGIQKKYSQQHISNPIRILKELERSKASGNVLGIFASPFGKLMFLTAIQDIMDVENSPDKLVILKKYDLQGALLPANEICLSEIYEVKPFKRKFVDDASLFTTEADVSWHEPLVKIRCLEQVITIHELRVILIKIINSGYRIAINLVNDSRLFDESCFVLRYEPGRVETIAVSVNIDGLKFRVVELREIESIEFDAFFYFKGLSSKVFRVLDHHDVS